MGDNSQNRREFLSNSLKGSLGLLALTTFGGTRLYGRIFPQSVKQLPGNMVAATYTLKISDFPTVEVNMGELGPVKLGLTEVGSSIKLTALPELLMNPDHCERSGRDGEDYPISVVRVKESGTDAFTAVSSWCPHNNKSQLSEFAYTLGDSGLFVCTPHEKSCYKADGSWVPPAQSPYPDAPPKDEFFFNLNPDGTPHLTSFRTEFDGEDTLTIYDVLCECAPCVTGAASEEEAAGYGLEQNYPNPVRNSTIFRFNLPAAAHVLLTVLSTDGEEVAVVLDQKMEGGIHNVDFKATELPTGNYFFKLQSSFGTRTRRMTVVK